jgi:hypothetical protein
MITAVTNFEVGLNVITELIVGYALPGRPIAMMMFKTWGYISVTQGNTILQVVRSRGELNVCSHNVYARLQAWSLHENTSVNSKELILISVGTDSLV